MTWNCQLVVGRQVSGVKIHYKLIYKSLFAWIEELREIFLEVKEEEVYQICLHFRSECLIKGEFFYDHIEIHPKGVFYG